MIELGQLEARYREFESRHVAVVVISLDEREDSLKTQSEFPHLTVFADAQRQLSDSLNVIHPHSAPDGSDTSAPTTILVDRNGIVRWVYRPDRFMKRLSPDEVLAAVDEHLR